MNLNSLSEHERTIVIEALKTREKELLDMARKAHLRGVKEGYTDAVLNQVASYTDQANEVAKVAKKAIGVGYYVK